MRKIYTALLVGCMATVLSASEYASIHGGKLLDLMNQKYAFTVGTRTVSPIPPLYTNRKWTLYDAKNDSIYYPYGWYNYRTYFPGGIKDASITLWPKLPNSDLRVHMIFVGSDATVQPVMNHANPDKIFVEKGNWDMQGTAELRCYIDGYLILDANVINAHGGGWLYYSIVEDIQNPEHVSIPEQYDPPITVNSNPQVTGSITFTPKSATDMKTWLASTDFVTASGDPSEPNVGSIKIIDKPSATGTKTRTSPITYYTQRYATINDYLNQTGTVASSSSSAVSSVVSSAVASSSSFSSFSSVPASADEATCVANGGTWDVDFGCDYAVSSVASSWSSSTWSSSSVYSSVAPSSSSVVTGTDGCAADEYWDVDFGCTPVVGTTPSSSSSSVSSPSSSSSSVSSEAVAVDNEVFTVAAAESVSASESNTLAALLLGNTFDLHGRIVKDNYGSVVYVTAAKNAYIYKGIAEGSIVWSKNIAPEFTGVYPATGIVKFGTLVDTTDMVGPEVDLANQSVPVIGYLIHYKKADQAAWLAVDLNENIMYKLSIVDGVPYRVELFGPESDVMKSMLIDLSTQTVSFGAAAVSSSSSSVAESSSSVSVASSSSSVSSISTDPAQDCVDRGGVYDIDFGCSI